MTLSRSSKLLRRPHLLASNGICRDGRACSPGRRPMAADLQSMIDRMSGPPIVGAGMGVSPD